MEIPWNFVEEGLYEPRYMLSVVFKTWYLNAHIINSLTVPKSFQLV